VNTAVTPADKVFTPRVSKTIPDGFHCDPERLWLWGDVPPHEKDSSVKGFWYVTTNINAVLSEGLKSRKETGVFGLGGGDWDDSSHMVSLTYSHH